MNNYFQDKMGPARMPINQNDLQQPQPSQIGMGPGTGQVGYGEGESPQQQPDPTKNSQYTWQKLGYKNQEDYRNAWQDNSDEMFMSLEGFTYQGEDKDWIKNGELVDTWMSKADAEKVLNFYQQNGEFYVNADAHGQATSYDAGVGLYKPKSIYQAEDGDWRIEYDVYGINEEGEIYKKRSNDRRYSSMHDVGEMIPLDEKPNYIGQYDEYKELRRKKLERRRMQKENQQRAADREYKLKEAPHLSPLQRRVYKDATHLGGAMRTFLKDQ